MKAAKPNIKWKTVQNKTQQQKDYEISMVNLSSVLAASSTILILLALTILQTRIPSLWQRHDLVPPIACKNTSEEALGTRLPLFILHVPEESLGGVFGLQGARLIIAIFRFNKFEVLSL